MVFRCRVLLSSSSPPLPLRFLSAARPMALYKCTTADRPYRRRRQADVFAPAPAPSYGLVQMQYSSPSL